MELKDEDIKKALECCSCGVTECVCNECPIRYREACLDDLPKFALDLINRQQDEIERLKEFITEIVRSDRELKTEAIKECVSKYTEMLIDEYQFLQIANIKRLEQKVLTEMIGG